MWMVYTNDWALYPGDMNEEGRVDVVMDLRLPPQSIAAGEQYVIDKVWFGGAEAGMNITVGNGTTLRPYFTTVPGYNSTLHFGDIAPRLIRQADLLVALGEMFNLVFHTDKSRREVYIEPMEEFYEGGEVVEITDRIDLSGGIEIRDAGLDKPQNYHFAYRNGDLASHRFNLENETTLGEWSFRNPLYGTKRSSKRLGSRLFTTTLNTSNILGSAPSASIMQVGDVGGEEENFEVAFTPRIVCYKGMRTLPNGESWGIATRIDRYPYAAFVDEESINLCFEKRNNIEGLNRYYLPMLQRQQESRRVTLDLRLTTAEIATLFTADGRKPSLRTLFRINIQGESLPFRLAKIEHWNAESNIVRCTFEQELNN